MGEPIKFRQVKLEGGWLMVKPEVEDLGRAIAIVRKHKDRLYDLEIKEHRKKRSLDANAYCWVLLDKLAEKLNIQKVELYRASIREIGGNSEIVCVKDIAVEKFRNGWEHNGLGWCTDTMPSKIEGCTNVILYYGSSTYDTAQMSRLIDNICQDCVANGIQVETPDKIAEMKSLWAMGGG